MKRIAKTGGIALIAAVAVVGIYQWGLHDGVSGGSSWLTRAAEAAGGTVTKPNEAAPDRYVYYPGTEVLGADEIRLIALGTGMPAARRSQAATCWLVELGNGDKFLFDIGTGANANMSALMIPFDFLNKVFLTHLHTDHWGDLPGLWAGAGPRVAPMRSRSGARAAPREEMGTKYAVEHFLQGLQLGQHDPAGESGLQPGQINVHEFDFKGENQVVYEENGVTIRSWPASMPVTARSASRCTGTA